MKFSATVLRLAAVFAAFALIVGVWATTAQATNTAHSLTGNARFQIGDGLPIPQVGFTPPPDGGVPHVAGAQAFQSTGPNPKILRIPAGQLHNVNAPSQNLGVRANNPAVFQVRTQIPIRVPGNTMTLRAGGRTGPPSVSFCPGLALNSCGAGPPFAGASMPGRMTYSSTGNQFGGPGQSFFGGSADVAIDAFGGGPGCSFCTAVFAFATPAGSGAQGGAFGVVAGTPGGTPNPSGVAVVSADGNGNLTVVFVSNLGAGLANGATSYAGPWTDGTITVTQSAALGSAETFSLSGGDARSAGGAGSISLVSAAVSNRTLSGPNANRGWLNLTLGAAGFNPAVPAMSPQSLAAIFGLVALAGAYALRRRSS
jgi:hypothetical protein